MPTNGSVFREADNAVKPLVGINSALNKFRICRFFRQKLWIGRTKFVP